MLKRSRGLKRSCLLALVLLALAPASCHRNLNPKPKAIWPPTAACSVDRSSTYPGDTVLVHMNAADPSGSPLTYEFEATGGILNGTGPDVLWSSSGLPVGTYTITAKATNDQGGKATCSAEVSIRERPHRPPVVSCSINPTVLLPGERASVQTSASSPDGDPLSYTYSSTAGRVVGDGQTAEFDSAGLPAGSYTVRCTVTNSRGDTTESTTSVSIAAPAPPPQATKVAACQSLSKNNATVARACMGLLDDVVLRLKSYPSSRVVIDGCAAADESKPALALARARNAGSYLVQHGVGLDRVRIRTTCVESNIAFEVILVPEGAAEFGTNWQALPSHTEVPKHSGPSATEASAAEPAENTPETNVFQGNVAYQPENPMTAGRTYQVIAKISPSLPPAELAAQVRQEVKEANPGSESSKIPTATVLSTPIKMTAKMRAHLTGRNPGDFEIVSVTGEDQNTTLQQVTTWAWSVKPLKSGPDQELDLVLSGLDEQGVTHFFEPIYKQHIVVSNAPLSERAKTSAKSFIEKNWQWLWATLLVPFVAWLWKKRKNRQAKNDRIQTPPDVGI
jgi:hypothetical protein